jgi:hypothetical protein
MKQVRRCLKFGPGIGVCGEFFFPVQFRDGRYISQPVLVLRSAPGVDRPVSELVASQSNRSFEAKKWFGTGNEHGEPQYLERLRALRDSLPVGFSYATVRHGVGGRLAVELADLLQTSVVTFNPIGLTALGDYRVPPQPGRRPGQTEPVGNYVIQNRVVRCLDQQIWRLQHSGGVEFIRQYLMQIRQDVKRLDAPRLSLWQSITPTVRYRALLFLLLRFKSFQQGNLEAFPLETFHSIPVMKDGDHGEVVDASDPPQHPILLQDVVGGLAEFTNAIKTLSDERMRGLMNWQREDGTWNDKICTLVRTISGPGFATMVVDSFTVSTKLHNMTSFRPYIRSKLKKDI